jgi:NAD(P)H dehydrogenase (quinone)
MADDEGVIRGPAGDGRVSAVAQADVAAAIDAVLLDPSAHEGSTYSLTGPESLTLNEVAATLTRVLGRDFSYVDETLEEAFASRASYGAPDWLVEAWVSTYTAIASGELEPVTGDVERLTGRPPTTLARLLSG